jgi:hypothetical protein
MNHLTNLYKHKCEQLQEHINNLTRMLNEVDAKGEMVQDIPVGYPGSEQHGPPAPIKPTSPSSPTVPPPQPTGNDPAEWNQWLDEMWQWYIRYYPYTLNGGNPENIQKWWRTWRNIQNTSPNDNGGWNWSNQPQRKGSPPRPTQRPGQAPF